MSSVVVSIPEQKPYEVKVEQGILSSIGTVLRNLDNNRRALIVTDTEVGKRYAYQVKSALMKSDYTVSVITIPSGESAKSIECAHEVWQAMVQCHLSRDSIVLALGGGVVGDLAGFCASTFMRGLRVVQVPTTLLSMVDSSVGGKTAINLDEGKNLVGTFWQPILVCADVAALATLPEREWVCGCAEIAKTAAIDSSNFFFWLVEHAKDLSNRLPEITQEAILRSIEIKASVVARDTQELKGVRESLNYGHTLAHAIEKIAGYGVYSHGEAVAQGMRFAARLGAACIQTDLDFISAQDALLDSLNLLPLPFKADPEEIYDVMLTDKKVRSDKIRFVLPQSVGQWQVVSPDKDLILEHLSAWQTSLKEGVR